MGFFNIHSVAKHQKNEGGKFLFSEKNLTVPKKIEGGTLWGKFVFRKKSLAVPKKVERKTLWGEKFPKKSLAVPKKIERGTLWFRPVWYVTRENRKNLFGSVR